MNIGYLSEPWNRTEHFLNGMAPKLPFRCCHTFFNFINIFLDCIYKDLFQENLNYVCVLLSNDKFELRFPYPYLQLINLSEYCW